MLSLEMRSAPSERGRGMELVKLALRTALGGYVAFAALNAQAADDQDRARDNARVAAAFGNTVIATYPDGRSQRIWLHPDGGWDGIGRNGRDVAGSWRLKDDKVCLRQSKPPTLPVSICVAFPVNGAPGVQWDSHDFIGRPIRLTLQRGAPPQESLATR